MAWCVADDGHDPHRDQEQLDGKMVDWMEKVSDARYQANHAARDRKALGEMALYTVKDG